MEYGVRIITIILIIYISYIYIYELSSEILISMVFGTKTVWNIIKFNYKLTQR